MFSFNSLSVDITVGCISAPSSGVFLFWKAGAGRQAGATVRRVPAFEKKKTPLDGAITAES